MTRDRDFKREVRARMRATGERYTQARNALHEPSVGTPRDIVGRDPERGQTVSNALLGTLDRDGYAVVRNVVTLDVIEEIRHEVDRLVDADLEGRLSEAQQRRDAGETDVRAFARGSEGRFSLDLADGIRASLVESAAELALTIGARRDGVAVSRRACLVGAATPVCTVTSTGPPQRSADGTARSSPGL